MMEGGDSPPQMKAQPPVSFTPADFLPKKLAGQVDFNSFSEQTKPQSQPMPQPPSAVALSADPPPLRPSPPQPQNRILSQPPVMVGLLLQQPVVSTVAHPSMHVMTTGQVGITESLTACSRNMSSSASKSKQRSSEVEQSVDMDTNIPSEEQANRPIETEENEEATQQASQPKRHGKQVVRNYSQRAECWKHFDEVKEDGKRVAGKCKYCNVIYKADPNKNRTKNLNKHFVRCSQNPQNQSKQTQTQLIFEKDENNEGEARLKSWVLNPHEARASIAKMIIMDELPFRFVENAGFRQMMFVCCPTVNMPSRITVAKDIYSLYVDERVKLKEYLVHACQRVCVTTDTWTSLQRINYMCVTANFIDNDWKLHKKIINFCTISSHKGDDIAFVLGKCLEEWGLASKLYTVTVNNASSNNTACTALVDDFKRHGHFLFSGGEFLHVRCIAHILNLIVWDGLKVVGKSVKRVRAAVRFIRQSPSRLQRFQECVIAEKIESKASLSLDVPTRWNSTYKMLSTALVYEHAFTRYSKRDPYYNVDLSKDDDADRPPNSNDWKQVQHLLVFLEVFYNVTLRLSGTLYVTSNLLFFEIVAIHTMLKNLEEVVEIIDVNDEEGESTVTNFKEMAKKMRMKYDKYYGTPEKMNLLVYIALIFDPRYKLAGLELSLHDLFGEEQGFALGLKVKQKVEALFEEYWQLYQPLNSQSGQSSGIPIEIDSTNANVSHGGAMSYAQRLRKKLKGADGGRGVVRTELQKYLNEGLEEDDIDVLTWWKVHGPRYPVVARMARDVLAVPVSTVASESAFSAGGRTLDTFRTSLTPKMVQALICAQDWLRPNTKIDVNDYFDELRELEKDLDKIGVQDNVIDVGDTFNH